MGALGAVRTQHGVDRFQPFPRLGRINVVDLGCFEHRPWLPSQSPPGCALHSVMICAACPASMPRRRSLAHLQPPAKKPRNDRGSSPQGQGNAVSQSLPEAPRVELRSMAPTLRESTLARADAAVLVLPASEARAALARLPNSGLWRSLYGASLRADPEPVLAARLPNRRATLAVVGFVKDGASAFQRLRLAGRLMREALKPGVAELQVHAVGLPPGEARAALEALASAALAAAAPMPSRRSKPRAPSDLRRITIGGRGLDLVAISAEAEGNHLARWLAMLPPNELDVAGYRRVLRALAAREGWQYRFQDERSLRRLGAGAFLAVSRGSGQRASGIVRLRYRPRGRAVRRIALVGKGI